MPLPCPRREAVVRSWILRRHAPSTAPAPAGQPSSELPTVCQLRGLPANSEVLAVGSHHGVDLADIRIAGNKGAVHEAQVVVNKPGVPVVLVLSAYESVVWRVDDERSLVEHPWTVRRFSDVLPDYDAPAPDCNGAADPAAESQAPPH